MVSPGRQEQIAAENAALINAMRMKTPLVVVAWPDRERAESHLSYVRAKLASHPRIFILGWMLVGFMLGASLGVSF